MIRNLIQDNKISLVTRSSTYIMFRSIDSITIDLKMSPRVTRRCVRVSFMSMSRILLLIRSLPLICVNAGGPEILLEERFIAWTRKHGLEKSKLRGHERSLSGNNLTHG